MKVSSTANDGRHIVDYRNWFEWWYFDFDSETGHTVYIEWHSPVFNLRNSTCILVVRIFAQEKGYPSHNSKLSKTSITKTYRYSRSTVKYGDTACDILFPGGHIYEKNGSYFIEVSEKDLSISLSLEKSFPFLPSSEELLYRSQNGLEHFFWYVPVPRAHATGEVGLHNLHFHIDGLSYHDHNWGNLNIAQHLKGWIWARVFFRDFTLCFGELSPKHSDKKYIIHVFDKSANKISTEFPIVSYTRTRDETFKVDTPDTLLIEFGTPLQYRVEITSENNLTKQEFPISSFDNHQINTCIASIYYFLRLNRVPESVRKFIGRGAYFQFEINARLFIDNQYRDTGKGRMEVFFFDI